MDTVITGLTQSPIIQYLSTSSEHLLERFINDLPDNKPIHSVRTIIQTSPKVFKSASEISKVIDFDIPKGGSVIGMYLHMLHKSIPGIFFNDYKREHFELEIAASIDRVELICDEQIIESIPGICLVLKNLYSDEEAESTLMPTCRFQDNNSNLDLTSNYTMDNIFFIKNDAMSNSTGTPGQRNFHTLTPLLFSTFEYTKDAYNTNVMKPLKVRLHVRRRNLASNLPANQILHYTEQFDLRIRYLNLEKSVENNIRNINFPENEVQNIYTSSFYELRATKLLNCNSGARTQRSLGDTVDYENLIAQYNLTPDDFASSLKEREVAIFDIPPHFYFTDFFMIPYVSYEQQYPSPSRLNGMFPIQYAYDFVQYAYSVNKFTASLEANGKTLLTLRPEEIVFSQKSNSSLYDINQIGRTTRDDESAIDEVPPGTNGASDPGGLAYSKRNGDQRRNELFGFHFSFGMFGTDMFLNGGFDASYMTNARIVLRIQAPEYTIRNNFYSPGQLYTKYNEDPATNSPGKLYWKAFGKYATITRIDGSNGSVSRLNDF